MEESSSGVGVGQSIGCFERIGAGTFASVYVQQSKTSVALKQVADPSRSLELENGFKDLCELYKNFQLQGLFHLPKPLKCYCNMVAFRNDAGLQGEFKMLSLQETPWYAMQRVWPVPSTLKTMIQKKFFPLNKRDGKFNFIARLYIGRVSPRPLSQFFNPNNFPLDAERMVQVGLPIAQIAHDMGLMLGSIHFVTKKDGRDIEFVLGGNSGGTKSKYFCIDFNQMRNHNGSAKCLLENFCQNDPYYPRPQSPYWIDFVRGYFKAAQEKDLALAKDFITCIEEMYQNECRQ